MGTRREAREIALQSLYQIEVSQLSLSQVLEKIETKNEEVLSFVRFLVEGVSKNQEEIDQKIRESATHWKLERMPIVDRNLLRLATFELKECFDMPIKVILNEAIEIAKKYGSADSAAFINGVLDKVAKLLRKDEI